MRKRDITINPKIKNKMKILLTLIAFTCLSLSNIKVHAQSRTADSIKVVREASKLSPEQEKQLQHEFYKRQLQGDTEKAQKVQAIMTAYKAEMKAVEKEAALDSEAKKGKYQALIETKNQKLAAILSPEELKKFVPSNERETLRGTKKN
jgi:Skp family chaperone for outer membrane proteins